MKTAKELAYKAYCHWITMDTEEELGDNEIKARFENWWSEWYYPGHRDSFHHEHNVYIDGKRYIQAE